MALVDTPVVATNLGGGWIRLAFGPEAADVYLPDILRQVPDRHALLRALIAHRLKGQAADPGALSPAAIVAAINAASFQF